MFENMSSMQIRWSHQRGANKGTTVVAEDSYIKTFTRSVRSLRDALAVFAAPATNPLHAT